MRGLFKIVLLFTVWITAFADQQNPQPSDITFYLYTRSNQNNGEVISYSDPTLNPLFDGLKRTYAVAHGFSENVPDNPWILAIKDLLLSKEDANVILMDWGILSADPRYDLAAPNTKFAGGELALLMQDLSTRGGLIPSNVHLIGFSLGSQVVGVCGNQYGLVDRITGLDPAAPLFENVPLTDRLDTSDATFVDVIHTNSGLLITGHLSFLEALGHIDFYPNGGHDQRGCPPLAGEVVGSLANLTLDQIDACSHLRAPSYFITSLSRDDFIAYSCSGYKDYQNTLCTTSTEIMGWGVSRLNTGEYYIETLVDTPFIASQIKTDFALDTTTKGSLVLRNTVPGLDQDDFEIFSGNVDAATVVSKIITASDGGVTGMLIELQYDADGTSGVPIISISTINGQDILTGEQSCIGTGLSLQSEQIVSVTATTGTC